MPSGCSFGKTHRHCIAWERHSENVSRIFKVFPSVESHSADGKTCFAHFADNFSESSFFIGYFWLHLSDQDMMRTQHYSTADCWSKRCDSTGVKVPVRIRQGHGWCSPLYNGKIQKEFRKDTMHVVSHGIKALSSLNPFRP